jgi:lipid-binding SYLF domain-containing protein
MKWGIRSPGKEKAMNLEKRRAFFDNVWPFLFGVLLSGMLIVSQSAPVLADERRDATQLVEKACMTFGNFMRDSSMGAYRDLLKKAKAAVVAPDLLEGAFVLGASGGNAIGMVRDEKTGQWSEPAFYTIGGASVGLQIGGQSSEVVLLAMTDRGMNALLGHSLKLGVDAGVAAGPVGIGAEAASANLSADILSFSRSKGLYGGISLDGSVIAVRESLNEAYYGRKVSTTDILVRHEARNPQTACLVQGLVGAAERRAASYALLAE